MTNRGEKLRIHEEVMYVDKPREFSTAVYRCYDDQRNLLYVGMTLDPDFRLPDHRRKAPWWPLVDHSRTHVTWYKSRPEARRAERLAIRTEGPAWNKRHW